MHHQAPVGVAHGVGDPAEQREALPGGQRMRVAVRVQRDAVDVLHHQIRHAFGRRAAVNQLRDTRMVERREDLPLGAKAPQAVLAQHAAHDLDRHALMKVVVSFGEVHRAHAAVPDFRHDAVPANPLHWGADYDVVSRH